MLDTNILGYMVLLGFDTIKTKVYNQGRTYAIKNRECAYTHYVECIRDKYFVETRREPFDKAPVGYTLLT